MICFTLSDCILKYYKENPHDKEIYAFLWRFIGCLGTQKLIIDNNSLLIDYYNKVAIDNYYLQMWLKFMAENKECWERIELDENSNTDTVEDLLLSICSQSDDKIIIVSNRNGWIRRFKNEDEYVYDGVVFKPLDREQTCKFLELTEQQLISNLRGEQKSEINYNFFNSIVADHQSIIKSSKVENNG